MKIKIILLLTTLIFGSWFQLKYLKSVILTQDILTNLVTFLSILFGFYITSLAIFVTSRFVKSLYLITDEKNKSQTLLNRLLSNYKFGLIIALLSLSYFLLLSYFISSKNEVDVYLYTYITLPLSALILFNIIYSYFMLNDLIKIIIQEAKN